MNLICNQTLAEGLKSPSQRARAITEGWVTAEAYCLNCTSMRLHATASGTPFRDHQCPRCGLGYELKSGRHAHTRVVQDGGYDSMMREIRREDPPALMLLQYDALWSVRQLVAIPPVFLTPAFVRKRLKPLYRPRTNKEYWMCDFNLRAIPPDGKIVVVNQGTMRPITEVRSAFAATKALGKVPLNERGWISLVLAAVRQTRKTVFSNEDIYAHEANMRKVYPNNKNICPKIRQKLQDLAALGYIERIRPGVYRILNKSVS